MEKTLSQWIIFGIGFLAQGLFSARILVQWIMSERKKKVVSPTIFWVLSLLASYLFFIYGWLRDDFAIMFGQVISYYIYMWNLKIKGVWSISKDGRLEGSNGNIWWKGPLLTILLITPVVGIGYVLSDTAAFKQQFFQNSNIPLWLVIYGSLGQVIFTLRFVYQFFYSRKRNESYLPAGFWIISLIGSAVIVSYAIIRRDPVLALGQATGFISYSRNLMILHKQKKKEKEAQS
ncbi:MAG: lipid-A-disaccharide synthase N-terminal domain-containing protein [Bacteroidales bacterium]|nr:lipid-A-disaccharide synthase N-terminal domain-containing protein [Bacteroidales bacterium]